MLNHNAWRKFVGVVLAAMVSVWATLRLDATVKRAAVAGTETASYEMMKVFCMWGICILLTLAWLGAVDRWKGERK